MSGIPLRELQGRQEDKNLLRTPLASGDSDNPGMATTDTHDSGPNDQFAPHTEFAEQLRTTLLTLKLKAVWDLYCRWYNIRAEEEEKYAMRRHRGHAPLGSLIHFISVGACLALVSLNLHELHELLMISSLTAIVLSLIRKRLLFGQGLPFGALFAGQQFRDLSFFWSEEFLATVRTGAMGRMDQFSSFLALLIIATLLGVSVGPSSAQLMRPQLDDWPAGGTILWLNGLQEDIFPRTLESSTELAHCEVDTGDQACPYGGWEIIDKGYTSYLSKIRRSSTLPEWLLIDGPKSQRFMELRIRASDSFAHPLYTDAYTRATVPISAIADNVSEIGRFWAIAAANVDRNKRLWSRKDAKYSIDAIQPAIATNCISQDTEDRAYTSKE
ncbi:hypothetical protein SLS56_002972 [Neofusicoccum ribis]|uniref:Uncharacterized protein n=1 Tax=Neofusicoccum ribis TaxID=45134 RepID=A0ABR3T1A0_9PEZI